MKSLVLMAALLSSSVGATQESQMRFTAPIGTVSDYKGEGTGEFKNTLVSVKSLDGKGIPQGFKEFALGNFSTKTIFNAEHRVTVLEQDENSGVTLQHSGWNRLNSGSSIGLGPRFQLDYKMYISSAGEVEVRDIVTSVDRTTVPQGWSTSAEKGLLESEKSSAYYSALWRQALSQPFELGGRQPIMATPEQFGQKTTSKSPQKYKLGEVKLLERTPESGFRFALDMDSARYAPETLGTTNSSYRVKVYTRQNLEFGADGRLVRSSGSSTNVLQRPAETREFQGRKFEVVTALVTTSSSTSVRSDANDKTP